MAKSANLGAAKNAKQDEFYTQLSDIEKEMRHYRRHFKDKTILCNCDDPFESNFFKFFVLNFNLELSLFFIGHGVSPIIRVSLQYVIMEQMFVLMGRSGLVP